MKFHWPTPSGIKPTLQEAICDLPTVESGQRVETLSYEGNPSNEFSRRIRRNLDASERHVIRDHITSFVRDDDAEILAGMEQGQTYRDVPSHGNDHQ